jgi:hypothetical protein
MEINVMSEKRLIFGFVVIRPALKREIRLILSREVANYRSVL